VSDYQGFQAQRAQELTAKVAMSLRDLAERIERENNRPMGPYNNPTTRAAYVVHEVHTVLANLPLYNLIVAAQEATSQEVEDK
jgi:hypothetical protein